MNSASTLKKNSDFHRLYNRGKASANPFIVVYCRKNGRDLNRIGYTVSKSLVKQLHVTASEGA